MKALRHKYLASRSSPWTSRTRENSTGIGEDKSTQPIFWSDLSSSPRHLRSLSRNLPGAEVASEETRKNELLEVSNDDTSSQVADPDNVDGLNHVGEGGLEFRDVSLYEFDALESGAPMTAEALTSSGFEPIAFGAVNFPVQAASRKPEGSDVVACCSLDVEHSLKNHPFNSGFDTSPMYSDWNESPLFASRDYISNRPSLFPETTTATLVVEGETPQNNHTGQGGDLEHQTGQRLNTPLPLDVAFNGACLDAGDVITVKEDDESYDGQLVKDSATNHQASTPQPFSPAVEPGLSQTKTRTHSFVSESSSSSLHVEENCDTSAAIPLQQQEDNGPKVRLQCCFIQAVCQC